MNRILALIMAGGSSDSLGALTEFRADAALHFGGKFRLIDFSLSNLTNSGIYNIGILTQYMPRSLNDHIGVGKPWDLDRANSGVRLLQPYMGGAYGGWQKGNADAVRRNLDFIRNQAVDDLLILAGDHIYLMDYRPLLARQTHGQCSRPCRISKADRLSLCQIQGKESISSVFWCVVWVAQCI